MYFEHIYFECVSAGSQGSFIFSPVYDREGIRVNIMTTCLRSQFVSPVFRISAMLLCPGEMLFSCILSFMESAADISVCCTGLCSMNMLSSTV